MSDPRIEIVAQVLRDNGVQANLVDTDTLATQVVNRLDADAAGDNADGSFVKPDDADPGAHAGDTAGANAETPTGTATEGGAGSPSA